MSAIHDTEPHWLDVMPAIPLARGVPVVSELGWRGVCVATSTVVPAQFLMGDLQGVGWAVAASWRVDLDDPQGRAYARRELAAECGFGTRDGVLWSPVMKGSGRWMVSVHGDSRSFYCGTTDPDLALARAIAEVTA